MQSASRVGEPLLILIFFTHFRKKKTSIMGFSFDPGEPSKPKILKKTFQLFKKKKKKKKINDRSPYKK